MIIWYVMSFLILIVILSLIASNVYLWFKIQDIIKQKKIKMFGTVMFMKCSNSGDEHFFNLANVSSVGFVDRADMQTTKWLNVICVDGNNVFFDNKATFQETKNNIIKTLEKIGKAQTIIYGNTAGI